MRHEHSFCIHGLFIIELETPAFHDLKHQAGYVGRPRKAGNTE